MDLNLLVAKLQKIHLLRRIFIQKFQPGLELYFGQLPILKYIIANDGCTQNDLAEKLQVTPASISTSTKRLQKAGLLTKKADPDNLRRNRLSVTPEGVSRCQTCDRLLGEFYISMFAGVSEEELADLSRILDKILMNMAPEESGSINTLDIAALVNRVRENDDQIKKRTLERK